MPIESNNPTNPDKRCSICGSTTSYRDKNEWGEYEHWYGNSDSPICKRCFMRSRWQNRFVPINVKCDRCQGSETMRTKYGTPQWVRNKEKEDGYLCWSCYIIKRNTGRIVTKQTRDNHRSAAIRARNAGVIFGRRIYTINETVFDTITEECTYWVGFLMADGSIYSEKTGNPRISLTLKREDRDHLVRFTKFLCCSYQILPKNSVLNGKAIVQYTLRFSSKQIAEALAKFGVTAKKSLIAKVIGLENDRHFWRGVMDGDGWFGNRNGHDGDKIVLVGSRDLLYQFKKFISKNIPGASVRIKPDGKYCCYRLYVYSNTARMLAKLLYDNCLVALDRKLAKANQMFTYIQ